MRSAASIRLRVIGRNAVLRYKKRPPTQQEIASELGANYLVAGSVRRSGKHVRIAAQLTESRAGTVMWSDRYDGELADIFEFQDTIARRIAGTLAANITQVEGRRSLDQPKPNPNAFDLVLRARALGHAATRTANRQFPRADRQGDRTGPELCRGAGAAGRSALLAGDSGLDGIPRSRTLARRGRSAQRRSRSRPTSPTDTARLAAFFLRAPNTSRRRTRSSARSKSTRATPMPWRHGGRCNPSRAKSPERSIRSSWR